MREYRKRTLRNQERWEGFIAGGGRPSMPALLRSSCLHSSTAESLHPSILHHMGRRSRVCWVKEDTHRQHAGMYLRLRGKVSWGVGECRSGGGLAEWPGTVKGAHRTVRTQLPLQAGKGWTVKRFSIMLVVAGRWQGHRTSVMRFITWHLWLGHRGGGAMGVHSQGCQTHFTLN